LKHLSGRGPSTPRGRGARRPATASSAARRERLDDQIDTSISPSEPVNGDQPDRGRVHPGEERRDPRAVKGSHAVRPTFSRPRGSTDDERVATPTGPDARPPFAGVTTPRGKTRRKGGAASMVDSKHSDTSGSRRENARTAVASETEQLLLTLSVATGEIVKVEKLDQGGKRHELSAGDYAELADDDDTDELEAALEEAYEVGVGDALGEDNEEGDGGEELALRRLAVGRLLVRGMLRRGLRRRLLRRAIRREVLKRGAVRRGKERP
jgi:hypothetical protein